MKVNRKRDQIQTTIVRRCTKQKDLKYDINNSVERGDENCSPYRVYSNLNAYQLKVNCYR